MKNNSGNQKKYALWDSFGRPITYLRVSITDRCNMKCVYCMGKDVRFLPPGEILTYEEIARVARISASMGVCKIRLTGGEPLARRNVEDLIGELSKIPEIQDLSLTTNGLLLEEMAGSLVDAGLHRVNVSLDTLNPDKFQKICRAGHLEKVISGIKKANNTGLKPVKVNVVVMRGRNDDEIGDFLDFAAREKVIVRFIEYMPLNMDDDWKKLFVPRYEMLEHVQHRVKPSSSEETEPNAPAHYFDINDSDRKVGFISPITHGFCSQCNRMRLTPEGRLFSCLLSKNFVDLKELLRTGCKDTEIDEAFKKAAAVKGEKGRFNNEGRPMHSIGG